MVIEEKERLILQYFWVDETKLLYVMDQHGDENYHLYSINVDGHGHKDLTPFEGVSISEICLIEDEPSKIIVFLNKNNPENFEPYRVDVNTGELKRIYRNKRKKRIDNFYFDKKGELSAIVRHVNNLDYHLFYKSPEGSKFEEVISYSWKDHFEVLDFHPTKSHLAYVASNIGRDKIAIVLFDFLKKKEIEVLFENKNFDASNISLSKKRKYEIDYFTYIGEKKEFVPVSRKMKNLLNLIKSEYPLSELDIISKTKDETEYLIKISNDKIYGRLYTYQSQKEELKFLVDLLPQLCEEDMAQMKSIQFKSRDGYDIFGYITLPLDYSVGKKVPLIVNPHGGPYGERDVWGFDPESQLFASRGYATLQINFRGSGGFGKQFYLLGSKEIGRKMLNDLEDGVMYVLKQGWIDSSRIAIYGASYGGLATLGSLIKTPDLYSCGIDYVGVSNLFTFINSFPSYWKPYMKEFYAQWYDPDIPNEKLIMEQVSPSLHVDKIKAPVFIIQGANDPRVNIKESDQMVEKLRSKGFNVPYLVKYNEGHGFQREENLLELYKSILGFFAKHLS